MNDWRSFLSVHLTSSKTKAIMIPTIAHSGTTVIEKKEGKKEK